MITSGDMLKMQRKLDRVIEEVANDTEDVVYKKILALQVEIGEALNEWRGFKFWSSDLSSRREELLEELADCWHFILSLANDIGVTDIPPTVFDYVLDYSIYKEDVILSAIYLFESCSKFARTRTRKNILDLVHSFASFVSSLEVTREELTQSYVEKNEENMRRQEEGY